MQKGRPTGTEFEDLEIRKSESSMDYWILSYH